ncbi:MAG: hypothetical protein IJQ39_10115 [Thermoguttaceae bacterium]|nr:hypothetical protein [Thermoguttaceae bacterium]
MKKLVTFMASFLLLLVCLTTSSQAMEFTDSSIDFSFLSVDKCLSSVSAPLTLELNRSITILLVAIVIVTIITNWERIVDLVKFLTTFHINKWQSFRDILYYLFICVPAAWVFRILNQNRPKSDKAPVKYECFFKWYEGVDATHCKTREEWEKVAKLNRKSELFRRAYNVRFLGPGKGWLDSWGLWLFHCNGIALCFRYLFLLLVITLFFTCVYKVFINTSEPDDAIRNSVLSLWGSAEDKQISFFLLMIHWFVLTLISAIVLAIITKKVVDRRPNLLLPERLIFDPKYSTFIIWLCNKDSSLLVDLDYRLEFNVTFNDAIKSRHFRGQNSIANSFTFLSSFDAPTSSLDGMRGLVRKTQPVKPGESVPLTVERRGKPTPISMDSCLYGIDNTLLFPLFDDTPNIKKTVRLFVYVTDLETGQKFIFTKDYIPDNIICGSNAGLQPMGTTDLPTDWRVCNMFNWGRALPFDSIGFQGRVKHDEHRRENDAARERIKVFEKNGTDEEAAIAYQDFLDNHEYEEGQKQQAQAAADKAVELGEDPQAAYDEVWYPHDLKVVNCDTCPYSNCPLRGKYPSENPSQD